MENSKNSKPVNEKFEDFLRKTRSRIIQTKEYYNSVKTTIRNTPLQIKIANIVVPFIFTYIFTLIYYNLPLSILFAIITFAVIFLMSSSIAIIFIILYIIIVVQTSLERKTSIGEPILETDINKNKAPYDCLARSLTVTNNKLAQDLQGGYFTYSFWLYLKGNNNSINNDNNWHSYRYNEWKSIFYRGNPIEASGDLSTLVQYPGFWLTPVMNNMVIVFQNGSYVERLEITNVPFNKWVNYSVVVEAKSVSIYINGLLDRTLNLYQNITIMNGYNLYLTSDMNASTNKQQSGFAGSIAQLIYYNYALTQYDINKSYNYYKKIIDDYQNKVVSEYKYTTSELITNSDYRDIKKIV